jgi:hypothetical protein
VKRNLAPAAILLFVTGCGTSPEQAARGIVTQLGGKTHSDGGHVVSVNLRKSRATDNDLASLAEFPLLERVVLPVPTTDAGLRHLEGMANLTSLDMQDTQATDHALSSFKTMPKLKQIYIHGSKITPTGEQAIKAELPQLAIERFPIRQGGPGL